MNCQIFRTNNEITRVTAPSGADSILYKSILDIVGDKAESLRIWARAYTPTFSSRFGDWQKYDSIYRNDPGNEYDINRLGVEFDGRLDVNREPLIQYVAPDILESQVNEAAVNAQMKLVDQLQDPKTEQLFKRFFNNNRDKFYSELVSKIGRQQVDLLRDWIDQNDPQDLLDIITGIVLDYNYVVEINTAVENRRGITNVGIEDFEYAGDTYSQQIPVVAGSTETRYFKNGEKISKEEYEAAQSFDSNIPTQQHSNLNVPGGVNYRINIINTPAIRPSIIIHYFSDNQIGWFRSDEQIISEKDKQAQIKGEKELQEAIEQGYAEPGMKLLSLNKGDGSKTRRILEVQSDLFQKGRDKKTLTMPLRERPAYEEFEYDGKLYEAQDDGGGVEYLRDGENIDFNQWKDARDSYEKNYTNASENQFLQLLNKNNNWVTFFIKSIIQDSLKKGYEKVLFPLGDTASKIEGHETLEEFKKQKEDRIKELEELKKSKLKYEIKVLNNGRFQLFINNSESKVRETKEELEGFIEEHKKTFLDKADNELNQLKEELERVEREGFAALRPIYNFYENTVGNILKKRGYNPVEITDEYGNGWYEITIEPTRDSQTILFSTPGDLTSSQKETFVKLQRTGLITEKRHDGKFWVKSEYVQDINGSRYTAQFNIERLESTINRNNITWLNVKPSKDGRVAIVEVTPQGKLFTEATTREAYNKTNLFDYYIGDTPITSQVLDKAISRMAELGDIYSDLYSTLLLLRENLSKNKTLKIKVLPSRTEAQIGAMDRAHYDPSTNTIAFYQDELENGDEAQFLADLSEEFLHALTVHPFFKKEEARSDLEKDFIKEITDLYDQARRLANDEERDLLYRMGNVYEFMVGVMQEPPTSAFRRFLYRIETQMPIFSGLINAIMKLFGKGQTKKQIDIRDKAKTAITNYIRNSKPIEPAGAYISYMGRVYAEPRLSPAQQQLYNDLEAKLSVSDKLNQNIDTFLRVVENTGFRLVKARDLAALREALKNPDGSNKFTDIQDLLREAKKRNDDLPNVRFKLRQLANALKEIEFFSDTILIKTKQEIENPNTTPQESISTTQYYLQLILTFENFLDGFNKEFDSNQSEAKKILSKIAQNFKDTKNYILENDKSGVVNVLKEQLTPLQEYVDDFYNTEIARLEGLIKAGKNVRSNKLLLKNRKAEKERFDLSREGILKYVNGEMGDTNVFSAFLEAYISSPDPVIGGFAKFLKTHMYDVEAKLQKVSNDFRKELDPLYKKAGVNRSNVADLGRKVTFVDTTAGYDNEGNWVSDGVKVLRFLTPYKDYDFQVRNFRHQIKELERAGDQAALLSKKQEFQKFKLDYMHNEYTPEYYKVREIFNTPIGQVAKDKSDRIWNDIRAKKYEISSKGEVTQEDLDYLKERQREYSRMFSLKNLDGTNKEGDELAIAKLMQEHRDQSRHLYEWQEVPGMFDRARRRFSEDLISKGIDPDSADYASRMASWDLANTRIVISEDFYTEREQIALIIDSLTGKIPGYTEKTESFSAIWNDIQQHTRGIRDNDNQPIGTEMQDGAIAQVKTQQELLERLKKAFEGINGLTGEENAKRNFLIEERMYRPLTEEEVAELNSLNVKSTVYGLNFAEKQLLFKAFDDLKELQSRIATDYYVDTINDFLEPHGESLTKDNADEYVNTPEFKALLQQDQNLRDWFNKNHISVQKVDKEGNRYTESQRIYVWNKVVPNNPDYISREPGYEYMTRKVRPQFVTERVVGKTVDNRGNWLPRLDVQGSPLINKAYYDLQKNDPTTFEILGVFTKYHLQAQEGLIEPNKLWMDVPSTRKSRLEAIQQGSLIDKYEWAKNKFKQVFSKQGDDYDEGLGNYSPSEGLDVKVVSTDLFNNELVSIPIKHTNRIPVEEMSLDVGQAIMKYTLSAETNKTLTEINPIAQAFKNVLESEGVKDTSKISRINLVQRATKVFVNKRSSTRAAAINNLIDREFRGIENRMELTPVGHKLANVLMGMAAYSSLALDIPGSIKNLGSAQMQNIIESIGSRYFNFKDWTKGNWEFTSRFMPKFIGDYNRLGPKSLESQLFDLWDPIQGNFLDSFGKEFGASKLRDFVSGSWMYAPRQFGELEAQGSTFLGMLNRTRVKQNGTEIKLIDAYEMGQDGTIKLKDGVDPDWAPTGRKFKDMKLRIHELNNRLQGNYARMDQPEIDRFTSGRLLLFLRKYFVPAFVNRYAYTRLNVGLTDLTEGYYITSFKFARNFLKTAQVNWSGYTEYEKRNILKTASEIALSMVFLLITKLLGFDEDDEDKFKKLQENSWFTNHMLYQFLMIKSEEEQFIPWLGFGINEITRIKNTPTIAFGHLDRYIVLLDDINNNFWQLFTDKDLTHFQRKTGYWEAGSRRDVAHAARILGFTGATLDPTVAIRNYYLMTTRTR